MAPSESYLIVGAGVFGVSTAYHLIKKYPQASITLVDRDAFDNAESRVAASWDWNKIVRADYDDFIYCKLALEAQDIFKSDQLWKPFFHETGIFWMCRNDYGHTVIDNYNTLGRKADLATIPIEQARKLYGGLFENADFEGVKEVLVNKTSGWAAAGDCLRAVTHKTLELGVKYVVGEVASLRVEKIGRRCTGVEMNTGQVISASKIILCTGAFTPVVLELSAEQSGLPNLRAGSRIVAGGITTGMTKLNEKLLSAHFARMPVGVQGYNAEQGPFIGSLPPTQNGELKWWGQKIFRNMQEILPRRWVSIPSLRKDYDQWNVPRKLKDDIKHSRDVFYGKKGKAWKMGKYRICWDAFTTGSDFIISPHPATQGLYVATCGSFHGWKFFPILGKYIVQMIEGSLSSELRDKWAWDRERTDPILNGEWPHCEMKDFLDPVSKL